MKFEPPFEKYFGNFFTTRRSFGKNSCVFIPHQKIEYQTKFNGYDRYESACVDCLNFMYHTTDTLFLHAIFDFENENTNNEKPSQWHAASLSEEETKAKNKIRALLENRWKEEM